MSTRVWLGVDIGKAKHYALAVDGLTGAVIHQTSVGNDEAGLQQLVGWAHAHEASVIVDQANGPAALLLGLCWHAAVRIGYLHGQAMARARGFYAGQSKTDPKDAFVLADVARAHPQRIVWLEPTPEARAQLELLCGYDADLRADANRLTNRLRGLLGTYWPSLERALDQRLDSPGVLALLQVYPTGAAIHAAGVDQVTAVLKRHKVPRASAVAKLIATAAAAQTIVLTGSGTAATLITELAAQLASVVARRAALAEQIEQAFFDLPEATILLSLPGVGPRLGALIALEIGTISRFGSSAQLAAYAGLGPTPRLSGTSRTARVTNHGGNHRLKNALFLAAFCSLRHPASRAYYDRKRTQGRHHNQAVLCLARRRVDVLYAMLKHASPYSPPL
jgi:transposase